MNVSRVTRLIGAPVAVVLATVVNASAFDPGAGSREPVAADLSLSWAMNYGATEAVSTRTLLARRAVSKIHSIERCCNPYSRAHARCDVEPAPAARALNFAGILPTDQLHVESSHQHAAP